MSGKQTRTPTKITNAELGHAWDARLVKWSDGTEELRIASTREDTVFNLGDSQVKLLRAIMRKD